MANLSGSEKDEFGIVLEQLRKIQAAMRVCVRAIQDARGRAWEWRDRRDELRGNQPMVHDEISEQRSARDELNVEVQRLKALRDEELENARTLQEKLQALQGTPGAKQPRISREELQRRFRELEWKQQTTSLSIDEERAVIEEMESLSQALETASQTNPKITLQTDEGSSLWQEAQAARDRAQEHHEAMIALVEEAQQKHQNIVQLSQNFGPSRTEMDEAHQMYVQCLQEADEMRERLDVLRTQETELQKNLDAIRNQRKETRKAREKLAMDKLAEQAREKQKTGQKLSMEELRALMESDEID
jgi:uncharacterized coiled-coil DUF342 family protein